MPRFAFFIGGVFQRAMTLDARPDDLPAKNLTWHPVGDPVEGDPPGWAILGDEAIETVPPSAPPPAPRYLEKATLVRRMTDAEVEQMQNALNAHPSAKMRELYWATVTFDHQATEFTVLKQAFIDTLGAARAAAVLEPEY